MKIVTWNCNGALRKKTETLDTLGADVYVVQECENPAHANSSYQKWAGDYLWVGTSKHRGIGIFPKKGNTVRSLDWQGVYTLQGISKHNQATHWATSDLKLFAPFKLNDQYQLLGVWTKADNAEVFGYIGQLWKYLQIHSAQLRSDRTIVLGDLNSNQIWDKPDRWWNHSDVVEELAGIGLHSVYHHQTGERQGQESSPTFYLQRNSEKAYHIDYVFASEDLLPRSKVQVSDKAQWLSVSDHMPMTLEIKSIG